MIVKEEDAKNKWCPEARLGSSYYSTANRDHNVGTPQAARCLGSGCMMWVPEQVGLGSCGKVKR